MSSMSQSRRSVKTTKVRIDNKKAYQRETGQLYSSSLKASSRDFAHEFAALEKTKVSLLKSIDSLSLALPQRLQHAVKAFKQLAKEAVMIVNEIIKDVERADSFDINLLMGLEERMQSLHGIVEESKTHVAGMMRAVRESSGGHNSADRRDEEC